MTRRLLIYFFLIGYTFSIEQIHLSLTDNPNETMITWTTRTRMDNNYILYGQNINNNCLLNNKHLILILIVLIMKI